MLPIICGLKSWEDLINAINLRIYLYGIPIMITLQALVILDHLVDGPHLISSSMLVPLLYVEFRELISIIGYDSNVHLFICYLLYFDYLYLSELQYPL
jgi:phosphate starvation-inducible membrane PsiE